MINRVDGQHNYTNPYERQKRKSGRVEADAPAFLLDYDEKGVVWERGSDSQKGQVPKESVSSDGKKEAEKKKKPQPAAETQKEVREPEPATKENKGRFFQNIVERLRGLVQGFLQLVWYSGEEKAEDAEEAQSESGEAIEALQAEEAADTAGEDAETAQELSEEEEDRQLRELIAKKDEKGFMNTLTRGNRRKPARNTSLLTSYDRRGRLVKPDDAEAGRLLHHENSGEKGGVTVRKQGTYRKYI